MMIYKSITGSYMTCVWGYEFHILHDSRFRNNHGNWFCITKRNSNLLYILDKWKNWEVTK